ncbi:MAG: 50S ribosomal protein L21 [Candidatus Latescibacterota bacterium]
MYAVVRIAGKQLQVNRGQRVRVPRLHLEAGAQSDFTDVLLVSADDGRTLVGTPAVEGASVRARVVGHGRGPKIVVFKMKRRTKYRRRNGHRQDYTEIRVDDIAVPGAMVSGAAAHTQSGE